MPITNPTDIPGCQHYSDMDDGAFSDLGITPCVIGSQIEQCTDLSGNGTHLIQSTLANRPFWTEILGRGVCYFNSAAPQSLVCSGFFTSVPLTEFTIVAVGICGGGDGTWEQTRFTEQEYVSQLSNVEILSEFTGSITPDFLNLDLSYQGFACKFVIYDGTTLTVRAAGPFNDTSTSVAATGTLGATGDLLIGNLMLGSWVTFAVYNRAINSTEQTDYINWALGKFSTFSDGAPASGSGVWQIACVGDSRTEGVGPTGTISYPTQLATTWGAAVDVHNYGVGGTKTTHLLVDFDWPVNTTDATFDPTAEFCFCLVYIGVNETDTSVAQLYDRIRMYCLYRRYIGWNVIVATIPPGGASTGVDNTILDGVNALIRANYLTFANDIADLAIDPRLSDPTNGEFFAPDELHFVTAGYGVHDEIFSAAIGRQISPAPLVASPGSFTIAGSPVGTIATLPALPGSFLLSAPSPPPPPVALQPQPQPKELVQFWPGTKQPMQEILYLSILGYDMLPGNAGQGPPPPVMTILTVTGSTNIDTLGVPSGKDVFAEVFGGGGGGGGAASGGATGGAGGGGGGYVAGTISAANWAAGGTIVIGTGGAGGAAAGANGATGVSSVLTVNSVAALTATGGVGGTSAGVGGAGGTGTADVSVTGSINRTGSSGSANVTTVGGAGAAAGNGGSGPGGAGGTGTSGAGGNGVGGGAGGGGGAATAGIGGNGHAGYARFSWVA